MKTLEAALPIEHKKIIIQRMSLKLFTFNDTQEVRTINMKNEMWFVGKDVAKSLEYVNTAKAIRTHVDEEDRISVQNLRVDDQTDTIWFVGKDIAKILEYKDTSQAVRKNVDIEDRIKVKKLGLGSDCILDPQTILINKNGSIDLVLKSRKHKAIDLARELGINVKSRKYEEKESECLRAIETTFKGEKFKKQYSVKSYRIDMYMPKYRIAIECDENGHRDRNIEYEIQRQKDIEHLLNCQFIRFNPDSKDFNIFEVLNQINKAIYQQ